jgi:hypothetical protein
MKRWNVYKAFLVLLVLFALLLASNEYLKPWFLVVWGAAAILTILRTEIKGSMAGW